MQKQLHTYLARGKDIYAIHQKEIKLASNIRVANRQLYQEIEEACKKSEGVLTYAEYLTVDQFGENGYYATAKFHGKTDVEKRWGQALANYCLKNGYETLIEFGCGSGELGVAVVKAYKKQTNKTFKWLGVEIDEELHKKIRENFKSQKLENEITGIVTSIDELPDIQKALIVFPYSLDNIPPQMFVNTKSYNSYPDGIIGIRAENGVLSEVIIPKNILQKKGLQLEKGFFKEKNTTFNFSSWKLRKGQRAYVSTDAFQALYQYAKKFGDNGTICIIDEFRKEPLVALENLGIPKSLYEKNLICYDRIRYYHESGKHNLYYPLYKDSVLKFLHAIGFQSIDYDIEQKKATELKNKSWFSPGKGYTTFTFFAKDFVEKKNTSLPVPFPVHKLY